MVRPVLLCFESTRVLVRRFERLSSALFCRHAVGVARLRVRGRHGRCHPAAAVGGRHGDCDPAKLRARRRRAELQLCFRELLPRGNLLMAADWCL